jgi:hypothetical protein
MLSQLIQATAKQIPNVFLDDLFELAVVAEVVPRTTRYLLQDHFLNKNYVFVHVVLRNRTG